MAVLELVRGSGTPFVCDFSPSGGYERCPDTFHLRFDPDAEPVGQAIVKAASFVHNTEPTELPPLARVIDPDALDAIVSKASSVEGNCVEVTFTYEDLEITVSSDGDIWLCWI